MQFNFAVGHSQLLFLATFGYLFVFYVYSLHHFIILPICHFHVTIRNDDF